MKKIFASFLALALALSALATAGNLSRLAAGQGAGANLRDTSGLQDVKETYERGWSWAPPVEAVAVSGTGFINVSAATGVSTSTYFGPFRVRVQNKEAAQSIVAGVLSPTVTAYGDTQTAKGIVLGFNLAAGTNSLNSQWDSGPICNGCNVYVRGLTAAASVFQYQVGHKNH